MAAASGLDPFADIMAKAQKIVQPGLSTNAPRFGMPLTMQQVNAALPTSVVDNVTSFLSELKPKVQAAPVAHADGDPHVDSFLERYHASLAYNTLEHSRNVAVAASLGLSHAGSAARWRTLRGDVLAVLQSQSTQGHTAQAAAQAGTAAASGRSVGRAGAAAAGVGAAFVAAPVAVGAGPTQGAPTEGSSAYACVLAPVIAKMAAGACPSPGPVSAIGAASQAGHEAAGPSAAFGPDGELSRGSRHWMLLAAVTGESSGHGAPPAEGSYAAALGCPSAAPSALPEALDMPSFSSSLAHPTPSLAHSWASHALSYLGQYQGYKIHASLEAQQAQAVRDAGIAGSSVLLAATQLYLLGMSKDRGTVAAPPWWRASVARGSVRVQSSLLPPSTAVGPARQPALSVPLYPLLVLMLRQGGWRDVQGLARDELAAQAAGRAGVLGSSPAPPMPAHVLKALVAVCEVVHAVASGSPPRLYNSEAERVELLDAFAAVGQEWQDMDFTLSTTATTTAGAAGGRQGSGSGSDVWAAQCPYHAQLLCLLSFPALGAASASLALRHPLAQALHASHPHEWAWHRLMCVVLGPAVARLTGGQGQGYQAAGGEGAALRMSMLGSGVGGGGGVWGEGDGGGSAGGDARYTLPDMAREAFSLLNWPALTPLAAASSPTTWPSTAGSKPYLLSELLLLCGQPEAAVTVLAVHGGRTYPDKHKADACHLALACAHYGLLRTFPAQLSLAQQSGDRGGAEGAGAGGGLKPVAGMGDLLWAAHAGTTSPPVLVVDLLALVGGYCHALPASVARAVTAAATPSRPPGVPTEAGQAAPLDPHAQALAMACVKLDYACCMPSGVLRDSIAAQLCVDTVLFFRGGSEQAGAVRALAARLRGHGQGEARPQAVSAEAQACRILCAAADQCLSQGEAPAAVSFYLAGHAPAHAMGALIPALASLAELPLLLRARAQGGSRLPTHLPMNAVEVRQRLLSLALLAVESCDLPEGGMGAVVQPPVPASSASSASLASLTRQLEQAVGLCTFYDRWAGRDAAAAVHAVYACSLAPQPASVGRPGAAGVGAAVGRALYGLLGTVLPSSAAAAAAPAVSEEEWRVLWAGLPQAVKEAYPPFLLALADALVEQTRALVTAAHDASVSPAAGLALVRARLSALHEAVPAAVRAQWAHRTPASSSSASAHGGMAVTDIIAQKAAVLQ